MTRNDVLKGTNGGLDIFADLYDGARENALGSKKAFRQGIHDTNASCHLKCYEGEWKLINYGEDAKPQSAIDCYMREHAVEFRQALYDLARRYNINVLLNEKINSPSDRKFVEARNTEKVGDFNYEEREFEPYDKDVWGQMVTEDVLKKYNYKCLNWYSLVYNEKDKNGLPTKKLKKVFVYASKNYPIYLKECGEFRKIYMPNEVDKSKRFFYNGQKDIHYINGLSQIKEYHKNNEDKLDYILICSGERDAINAAAYGYFPIWFNSETSNLISNSLISTLYSFTKKLINIPDIDETGINIAQELALKYRKIYTLFLPDKLKLYKDNRGKPRKDLRDYLDIWDSKYEFSQLLENALSAEFWEYDEKDKKYIIKTTNLLFFLKLNGFYKYKDAISKETKFIKLENYIVYEYEAKEIRNFIKNQLVTFNVNNAIIETFLNSKKSTAAAFDDLDYIELNFKKADDKSRLFFFKNQAVKVTKDGCFPIKNKEINSFVWNTAINKHNFQRLPNTIKIIDNEKIDFEEVKSNLQRFVINSSRIFWRDEFENRKTNNEAADKKYITDNQFNYKGSRLYAEEIEEQQRHIANKCYALGYVCHTFKLQSRAKALWLMENRITEEGLSSGGSGKSFLMNSLAKLGLLKIVTLEGRSKKLTDNQFVLERVSSDTDLLLIDDAGENLDFDFFYTLITNGATINRKNLGSYELPFEQVPYVAFTSNFALPDLGASTYRRILPLVYSDYYHASTPDNDYLETRTIKDDFGKDLFSCYYTEEEYNADINFIIDCEIYYLSMIDNGITVMPPMEAVYKRTLKKQIGDPFKDWADSYFDLGNNFYKVIPRAELYESYELYIGYKGKLKTKTNFMKALRAWCNYYGYTINPPETKGYSNGRIIQYLEGKATEMIIIIK